MYILISSYSNHYLSQERMKNLNSSGLMAPEFEELIFLNTPVAIFLSMEIPSLAIIAVNSSIVIYPSIFKS